MILVVCPSCGNAYKAKAELLGKKARCPACGKMFSVVASPEAALEAMGKGGKAAAREQRPKRPFETQGEKDKPSR